MSPTELAILQAVSGRADHAIREGHREGLPGLREVERELVLALSEVVPNRQSEPSYRNAIETLEDLRRAIEAELILEGFEEDGFELMEDLSSAPDPDPEPPRDRE